VLDGSELSSTISSITTPWIKQSNQHEFDQPNWSNTKHYRNIYHPTNVEIYFLSTRWAFDLDHQDKYMHTKYHHRCFQNGVL
jgi:hypothetical protein